MTTPTTRHPTIDLQLEPVRIEVREYLGTSCADTLQWYYSVHLVAKTPDGAWIAERCLRSGEHWAPAIDHFAHAAALEYGVDVQVLDDV